MADAHKQLLLTCPHCRTTSAQFDRTSLIFGSPEPFVQYASYGCPKCNKGILIKWHTRMDTVLKVWPQPQVVPPDKVPQTIQEFYTEAFDALHAGAPRAALLVARSAVQLAARTLGAPHGKLKSELKWLSDNGVIPPQLFEVADTIRTFGNDAAHPEPGELADISHDDAKQLLDFLHTFLEYAFTLPARLDEIKGQREAGT